MKCSRSLTTHFPNWSTFSAAEAAYFTSQQQRRYEGYTLTQLRFTNSYRYNGRNTKYNVCSAEANHTVDRMFPPIVIANKSVADWPYGSPHSSIVTRSSMRSQFYTFKRTRSRFENHPQDTSYLAYPPPNTRKEENQVCCVDTDRGILLRTSPGSAICVQNFDDSLNLAIRITYRSSQRSSSMCEPRHPLLKVVI